MDDTLIIKKLKENRLTYILMIIIYSIVMFISLMYFLLVLILESNEQNGYLVVLFFLVGLTRTSLVFAFSIHGCVTTNRCIKDKEYLSDYFKKNNIWKGFLLSAFLSPLFIIIYYKTYKIAGLYYVTQIDEKQNETISYKPLKKGLLYSLMVISIIVGCVSVFWDDVFGIYSIKESINFSNEERKEQSKELLEYMPVIWFYYDGNKTDIIDYNVDFSVFSHINAYSMYSSISNKENKPDDIVDANTLVFTDSKSRNGYRTLYSVNFESDTKCRIKDMPINSISIDYSKASINDTLDAEELAKAYITIDDYVINHDSDYNTVREIFKNVKINHAIVEEINPYHTERITINENKYNNKNNLTLNMADYCNVSVAFDENDGSISNVYIHMTLR